MERVAIFIDGSNFYHNLKAICGETDIDFYKLAQWLVAKRHLVRTYYYNCPTNDPSKKADQQRFFDGLGRTPYLKLHLGRLADRPDGAPVEKGIDIAIAVDMLSLAFKNVYDTAILISDDGDFAYAIDAVRELGKHVEALTSQHAYHVKQAADVSITLDKKDLQPLLRKRSTK